MANKTKKSDKVIREMLEELAQGKSLRAVLSPQNKDPERPCWETFRTWMKKDIELRKDYETAKADSMEFVMSEASELLVNSLAESRLQEKTDLGKTHLIKSFVDMSKWKAERIQPKYYAKKDSLQLMGSDSSPLVVKWDK
jgi:hypothetical protein